MKFKNKPDLQQKLAAEYVLGTLKFGARRRFEYWLQQDAALQQVVREWQAKLMPMAEFSKATPPAVRVWLALEKRLYLSTAQAPKWWRNLLDSLTFWRGLGLVTSSMAVLMLVVLMSQPGDEFLPSNNFVATLSDDKSQAVAVISGDLKHRRLAVRFVMPQNIAADKSLELWAVAKNGKVKSLGLVDYDSKHSNRVVGSDYIINLPMPEDMTPDTTPLLAITLEPKGGSGNPEKPSGPIIFKGSWLRLA